VHLGLDADERAAHVQRVLGSLPPDVPAVVAGDLNEPPGGPSWQALAARATDRGEGSGVTFSTARPRRRIDAVLVDPALEVASYGFPAGFSEADVFAASDHRPVLAEIVLPR
jgi:endonuclease/exonuclease/phosphatase family metal-dependent hydrolase